MKKAMVYIYESAGDKNTGHVDLTVEAVGAGRIFMNHRVVVLEDLESPWNLKHFEDVLQEILKGYPKDATVHIKKGAATELSKFAWKNRRRYVNRFPEKFGSRAAPTVPMV